MSLITKLLELQKTETEEKQDKSYASTGVHAEQIAKPVNDPKWIKILPQVDIGIEVIKQSNVLDAICTLELEKGTYP